MDIADETTHQSLAYVAAATRLGGVLSSEQLDEYSNQPTPMPARYRTTGGFAQIFAEATRDTLSSLQGLRTLVAHEEPMSDFLSRLQWISRTDDGNTVRLTALGKAILAELDNPKIDVSSDSPISVIIDPDDPLAYARIFDLVASSDGGLLVDPYLRFNEIAELLLIPTVTKILTSTHRRKEIAALTSMALSAVAQPPEVRTASSADIHDRFFIPDSGDVLIFGSSLNSIAKRPGVVTPITDVNASAAIRQAYSAIWDKSEPIEPRTPDEPAQA